MCQRRRLARKVRRSGTDTPDGSNECAKVESQVGDALELRCARRADRGARRGGRAAANLIFNLWRPGVDPGRSWRQPLVDHSSCLGKNFNHKGCLVVSVHDRRGAVATGDLSRFRRAFYECLSRRADALFELCDAVLCAGGPVRSLPELSLVAEHRRGHGALYDAVANGDLDVARLRTALASVPLPRAADGRLVLAVDVTCWLRR